MKVTARQVPNQISLEVLLKLARTVALIGIIFYMTSNELPYNDSYDIHSYFRKYYSIEEMPDLEPLANDYLFMEEVGGFNSLKNYLTSYYAKELFKFRFYDTGAEYKTYTALQQSLGKESTTWTNFALSNLREVSFTSITPFRLLLNFNKEAEIFEGGFVGGKTSELRTDEYQNMTYNETLQGYPIYIDVIGSTKSTFNKEIEELFDEEEIFGRYLDSVELSQGFYHPTYELLIYFELKTQYDLEGSCEKSIFVNFFHSSQEVGTVTLFIFLVLYGWIFIGDMIKLYQSIKNARVSSTKREPPKKKTFFWYLFRPAVWILSLIKIIALKIIIGFNSFYFRDLIQTIELITEGSVGYGVYLAIKYSTHLGEISSTFENVKGISDLGSDGVGPDALFYIKEIALISEQMMLCYSLITLLLGFKTLSTLMMMFPKTSEFFKEVLSATTKILPFFLLYGNIQIAFCVFFYYYFGKDLDEFKTFTNSFINTVGILFGNSTAAVKMSLVDFPVALFSVSAYFIVAVYIYSNMFFVYLKNESNLANVGPAEQDQPKSELNLKNYEKFVVYSIKDDFLELFQRAKLFIMTKIFKKPVNPDIDIIKRTQEIELDEYSSKKFDLDFTEKFLLTSKKFIKDSEMEVRVAIKEKRVFVVNLWQLVLNIIIIILLITANLLILDVNNSFENYQYFKSIIVQTTSTDTPFDEIESMDDSLIHAFNVTSFLCDGGANVTEVGNQSAFKNQVLFAFNRIEFYNSLESDFLYDIFPYFTKRTTTPTAYFQFDDLKTSFTTDLAYENTPAYVITFNCSDSSQMETVMDSIDGLFDGDEFYISYIDLIIFIQDNQQNLLIRGDIIYDQLYSGDLTPDFDAVIFNLDTFDWNFKNAFRLVCQIIVLIYTVYLIRVLVKSIFTKYRNYQMWYAFKIDPLPEMVKRHRWWKTPEVIRMLSAVLGVDDILTMIVIVILISYFVEFILLFIAYESAVNNINEEDSTFLVAKDMDSYFSYLRACILLSVITIFFNTLKALQIIGTFDQFKVIIRAFWFVASQIWPLLMLLIGTIISFTLWLYLSPNFYYYDPFDIVYNLVIFIQDLEGEYVIPSRNKPYFLLVFYLPFFIGIKFIIFNLLLVVNLTSYRKALDQVKNEPVYARPNLKEFIQISKGMFSFKESNHDFFADYQDLMTYNLQMPLFKTSLKDTIRQCEMTAINTPKKWASILGSFILSDWRKMKSIQEKVKKVLTSITKNTYTSRKKVSAFLDKSIPERERDMFDTKFLDIHEYFWEFHHLVNEQIDRQELNSREISEEIKKCYEDVNEQDIDEEIERLEAEVGASGRQRFMQKFGKGATSNEGLSQFGKSSRFLGEKGAGQNEEGEGTGSNREKIKGSLKLEEILMKSKKNSAAPSEKEKDAKDDNE